MKNELQDNKEKIGEDIKLMVKSLISSIIYLFKIIKLLSVCDLIISKYYYWTLVELKTCLHNAITHGEIYNRIDYSVVAHWLAEYDIERSNVTAEIEANTNNEYKHKINGNATFNKFMSELKKQAMRYRDWETDRKSTRLNSSHRSLSRMPSSA